MGLFSDNLERAIEAWDGWPNDHVEVETGPGRLRHSKRAVVFECTACGAVLGSETQLRRHIATTHGLRFTYLLVDGRVAQQIEVLERRPEALTAIVGHGPVPARVTVGPRVLPAHLQTGENNLLPSIPPDFSGTVHVTLDIDGIAREYHIAIGDAPEFRSAALIPLASRLQEDLDQGRTPDWLGYQSYTEALSINDFEKRFIDGFYEYSLGFDMEKRGRWTHSASHLERALHLLAPFSIPMAITAKRILGVRLNCFSVLRRCEPPSRFHLARQFFLDRIDSLEMRGESEAGGQTSIGTVYCDGFTERLLAMLKAFFARDFHNVLGPCEQLRLEPAAEDRNNADKLALLAARTCKLQGDRDAARRYYARIQDNPDFGREAVDYIRAGC